MGDRETYLRTKQVADALGVSASTIKRWVDAGAIEATRTTGKHRLVALSSALKFAREGRLPTETLIALEGRPAARQDDGPSIEALLSALRAGEVREASSILVSAYRSEGGAVPLADRVIRPLMERVGQLWLVGAWDVHHEHQAAAVLASTLAHLIRESDRPPGPGRPVALGAAPEGDVYTLPGLLGELVLREVGWDVRNLGADLPLRSLAAATRQYRPGLVFLSASAIPDRDRFLRDYSYFYEAASQVDAAIIVGGRALDPDLRSRLVYASFGDRMAHLAEFARRILPSAGAGGPAVSISHTGQMDAST